MNIDEVRGVTVDSLRSNGGGIKVMSSPIMSAQGGALYTFSNWSNNMASEADTLATFLELILGFLLVSADWEGGGAASPLQTHSIIHAKMQRK